MYFAINTLLEPLRRVRHHIKLWKPKVEQWQDAGADKLLCLWLDEERELDDAIRILNAWPQVREFVEAAEAYYKAWHGVSDAFARIDADAHFVPAEKHLNRNGSVINADARFVIAAAALKEAITKPVDVVRNEERDG